MKSMKYRAYRTQSFYWLLFFTVLYILSCCIPPAIACPQGTYFKGGVCDDFGGIDRYFRAVRHFMIAFSGVLGMFSALQWSNKREALKATPADQDQTNDEVA